LIVTLRKITNALSSLGIGLLTIAALVAIANIPTRHAKGQSTVLGPNIYAYTAVTAAQTIIGPNPTRHALQICNPGGTNILWIAPLGNGITGQTGAIGTAITPSANGAGTVGVPVTASGTVPCFSPPTNAPSIGQGWAAFSTTTPVTVFEWP
jgi:hypothetical protein